MDQFKGKEIVQAILIAENLDENSCFFGNYSLVRFKRKSILLQLLTGYQAFFPLVNVPLLDYALMALNYSGIEEVLIFCGVRMQQVIDYVNQSISLLKVWTTNMKVQVIGGEGCKSFGDVMRDVDSKGLIRGNFILLGVDTLINADLRLIFEEHRKIAEYDKGAVATVVFKETETHLGTDNEVVIAKDVRSKRLHFHERLYANGCKESKLQIPLEIFIQNSEIALLHGLIDPQVTIGSPSMLSLFSDNFDFETRDDFIKGLLINEEILDSRIYVSLLPSGQYARRVNNWHSYQIASHDIINRWVYPLVPDCGVSSLSQKYIFLKNNIYRNPSANLMKVTLHENVVIQSNSTIGAGTHLNRCVIGENVIVGENCVIHDSFLFDGVTIGDNCILHFCIVGPKSTIGYNCVLNQDIIVINDCVIPNNWKQEKLNGNQSAKNAERCKKNHNECEILVNSSQENCLSFNKGTITKIILRYPPLEDTDSSLSSDEDESIRCSPIQDDANIFLMEIVDSLTRGYEEKSNPDFLILEINSSRYAYNMSLKEVNINVVKAIFQLPLLKAPCNNIVTAVHSVFKQLGVIVRNYIKDENAMMDCLKALEDVYEENECLQEKFSQILYYLYDKDFVTENVILTWYSQLDENQHAMQLCLEKFIKWLQQSSDENEDSDE